MKIILYIVVMIIGYIIGTNSMLDKKMINRLDKFQSVCLILLILSMGIGLGQNKSLMNSISKIGVSAAFFAIMTVIFSIISVFIINKIIHRFGKGRK